MVTSCNQLKLVSPKDGKMYNTDILSTKGILRLIQSIPSKKAEPFKEWLAKVGSERLDEIADPEKAILRGAEYYRKIGKKVVSKVNAKNKEKLIEEKM